MLIILDIDGCLLDSNLYAATNDVNNIIIKKRPHVEEFIDYLFNNFTHISIWTSGTKRWAEHIVNNILNSRDWYFVWDNRKCKISENKSENPFLVLHKPLKTIWRSSYGKKYNYNKHNTLIVDNTLLYAFKNRGNLIHIPTFYMCDDNDRCLLNLINFLEKIKTTDNVRAIAKNILWDKSDNI